MNGLSQSLFHIVPWLPAQFAADPSRIDGVTTVMAWAIPHSADQLSMGRLAFCQIVQVGADRFDHVPVGAFPMPTNAIAASEVTATCRQEKRIDVIFDIKPVPHVQAIAIEGDWLTRDRLRMTAISFSGARGRNCWSSWSAPPASRRCDARR